MYVWSGPYIRMCLLSADIARAEHEQVNENMLITHTHVVKRVFRQRNTKRNKVRLVAVIGAYVHPNTANWLNVLLADTSSVQIDQREPTALNPQAPQTYTRTHTWTRARFVSFRSEMRKKWRWQSERQMWRRQNEKRRGRKNTLANLFKFSHRHSIGWTKTGLSLLCVELLRCWCLLTAEMCGEHYIDPYFLFFFYLLQIGNLAPILLHLGFDDIFRIL